MLVEREKYVLYHLFRVWYGKAKAEGISQDPDAHSIKQPDDLDFEFRASR